MKPQTIGRVLGIGMRVTGRIVGQTAKAAAHPAPGLPASRAAGQAAGQASRGLARGVGGFLRPFRRVGHTLWLEVMGGFFLLPVLVFAPTLWRVRSSYAHGPDHGTFLLTALVMGVFLYLGLSSFWRAWKK